MSGFPKILYSLRGREIFRNPLTPAHLSQPTQNAPRRGLTKHLADYYSEDPPVVTAEDRSEEEVVLARTFQNVLVNRLKPIRPEKLKPEHSTFASNQGDALRVYVQLRSGLTARTGEAFNLSSRATELGLTRFSYRRALDALTARHWVRKETLDDGVTIQWTMRPTTDHKPKSFQGCEDINLVPEPANLRPGLDEYEQRQLFLAFRGEEQTVALYLYLRKEATAYSGESTVTFERLSRIFQCQPDTISRRLKRLENMQLVRRDTMHDVIFVQYVVCVKDRPVEEFELSLWLKDPALQPPPKLDLGELVGRKTIRAQSQLILDFFEKATKARGKGSMAGMAHGGLKTANERAARNLARDWMFKDLQVALIFFVFEWRGDAVDEYGRTLTTFQHNLPAILEEVEEFMPTDRMYPTRMMKRYGLDAFFPIPETKDDRAAKIREEKAARYAEARRKEDEEASLREAPERPVRRPSRTRQLLLARKRIAS